MNTDSNSQESLVQAAQFLFELAEHWADELRSNARIKKLVTNPAVIGAYAEAKLRELVRAFVSPLRVSTGAVIDEKLCANPKTVPQIDIIIWLPTTAQAVCAAGDFALVPRGNVMGIIEVKRSSYKTPINWDTWLTENRIKSLVPDWVWNCYTLKKAASSDETHGNQSDCFPALGVELLTEVGQESTDHEHVLALSVAGDTQRVEPNVLPIHKLVNFLKLTRQRGAIADRLPEQVNVDLVDPSVNPDCAPQSNPGHP